MVSPKTKPPASERAMALESRALGLFSRGDLAEARPLLKRAMAGSQRRDQLRYSLASAHFHLGDVDRAIEELALLGRSPEASVRELALRTMAVYIPGDPKADNARILEVRRRWARLASQFRRRRRRMPRRPRLRIGYVCAFLDCRNWMKPVWPVLTAHDRSAFEVHLFVDRGLPSRTHGFVPNRMDRVHRLDGLSNREAAACVVRAKIDVLVDLNAFSFTARLGLFLRRPAPVQIGWFNTYATSGARAYDIAISDRVALPPAEKKFCVERIAYVDGSYLAFCVPYRVPRPGPLPCRRARRFTFGCLAPQYKVTAPVVRALASILRGAPRSRLILRNTRLGSPGNRAEIGRRFRRLGVRRDQLILEGPAPHFAFLRTYRRIDVALDTFPYSGGVTTMEALWQGVPVLTVAGDRWASRTSGSLLRSAGMGDWVCGSAPVLVRRAVALARSGREWDRLAEMRARLRRRLLSSAACDCARLCRQLEGHYQAAAEAARRDRLR
jgi:protein O-GlcNAc transferase